MDELKSNLTSKMKEWAKWPIADGATAALLIEVLQSGRWAISGESAGRPSFNELASKAIAEYHGISHCITCANGSSGLVIALEAVGVKHGDEVLVPGLNWVACATAVLRVGAVPVFVDIDAKSLCMSLEHATKSISSKTAAILLVHAYCSIADIDGFVKLSHHLDIPLIEDCSQAHGATYKGQRVGTFGTVGVFSFQQSKVLNCGEGGAVITHDQNIAALLTQLRTDGRAFKPNHQIGADELVYDAIIQGYNYCLSEFQAAILLDRIEHLDEENERRGANGLILKETLEREGNIDIIYSPTPGYVPTIYRYAIRIGKTKSNNNFGIDNLLKTINSNLLPKAMKLHPPTYASELFQPKRSGRISPSQRKALEFSAITLPTSELCYLNTICLPHQLLLGDAEQTNELARQLITILIEK